MFFGSNLVSALLETQQFTTVLNVGCGKFPDYATDSFKTSGKQVVTLDRNPVSGADIICDFEDYVSDTVYDCVFCSHTLEHARNVGVFIDKLIACVHDSGIIAITVPPTYDGAVISAGHLNRFSSGTLVYTCVAAGLNCTGAILVNGPYDIGIIVSKDGYQKPPVDWENIEFIKNRCRLSDVHII